MARYVWLSSDLESLLVRYNQKPLYEWRWGPHGRFRAITHAQLGCNHPRTLTMELVPGSGDAAVRKLSSGAFVGGIDLEGQNFIAQAVTRDGAYLITINSTEPRIRTYSLRDLEVQWERCVPEAWNRAIGSVELSRDGRILFAIRLHAPVVAAAIEVRSGTHLGPATHAARAATLASGRSLQDAISRGPAFYSRSRHREITIPGDLRYSQLKDPTHAVSSVRISRDGRRIFCASQRREGDRSWRRPMTVWSLESGAPRWQLEVASYNEPIPLDDLESVFAMPLQDGWLTHERWDPVRRTKSQLAIPRHRSTRTVDGRRLLTTWYARDPVTGETDFRTKLLELREGETGQILRTEVVACDRTPRTICLEDGSILCVTESGRVHHFDAGLSPLQLVQLTPSTAARAVDDPLTIGHSTGGLVSRECFIPGGQHLVCVDLRTATRRILATVSSGYIVPQAFNPAGDQLLVCKSGPSFLANTASVIDLASGRCTDLAGHSRVTCGCFTPDGQRVITGSSDGTIRFWDAATGRHLATLFNLREPGAFLWTTPPDEEAPSGWIHTNRADLLDVCSDVEGAPRPKLLDRHDPRARAHLATFNNARMVLSRIHSPAEHERLLADRRRRRTYRIAAHRGDPGLLPEE